MDSLEKALQKSRTKGYPGVAPVTENGASPSQGAPADGPSIRVSSAEKAAQNVAASGYKAFSERVMLNNRLVAALPRDPVADTYRMLRARVLGRLHPQKVSSIGVCSALPGEGKTLTAANLAISLGLDTSHATLLLDLDLKNPAIQKCCSLTVEQGVADFLGGHATLQECLISTNIGRLSILPAGHKCLNSSELLSSSKMTDLMRALREQHDKSIMICDMPPLLVSDDALVALSHIDASILVVREGQTTVEEIQRCLELLSEHNFIGTILNDSKDHFGQSYDY